MRASTFSGRAGHHERGLRAVHLGIHVVPPVADRDPPCKDVVERPPGCRQFVGDGRAEPAEARAGQLAQQRLGEPLRAAHNLVND
jgi:hypothetical protein